jgi:hypothetical protein
VISFCCRRFYFSHPTPGSHFTVVGAQELEKSDVTTDDRQLVSPTSEIFHRVQNVLTEEVV